MANKVMQILFRIKGQMDGSADNSLSSLNKKTAELSRSIRNLQKNMRNIKYSGVSAADNANLAKAISMNKQLNELIRKRAGLQSRRDKAAEYANAKQNLASQVGEAMALGAGIMTVTAPLRSAISGAMDFEKQMSRVSALSGANSEGLAQLTQKAEEMGAKLPFTTLEAGKAFEYMAMAGWKTQQMMAGIEPVMKLAMASGEDLAMVSDIVTDAMTAFGIKAEGDNVAKFSDVLAKAATNANTTVGLMGNTFQYVAPVAGALKYSIEDTALAIDMMANMGIKGEKAGTALRSTFSQVEKITEKLGIEVINAEDGSMRPFRDVLFETREAFKGLTDAEKKNKAEAIVGREAMSGFLALMNTSDEDMQKYIDAIDNAKGATDEMSEKMMNNAEGAWTKFTSALDVAGKSIGKAFLPAVKEVFEYLAVITGGIGEFVSKNQDLIESLGAGAAVLGGLLAVWKAVNIVMGIWSLIMAASPITWVIIGISALVAAGWYLYKNWDKVKAFMAKMWDSPAAAVIAFITGPIGWIIYAAAGVISHWDEVKAWFTLLWNDPGAALKVFVDMVKNKFADMYQYIAEKWEKLKYILSNPITAAVNFVEHGNVYGSMTHQSTGMSADEIRGLAAGGIYSRGAFLTTFAEDSGESAIPHTPTARNIGLLARTNEIMGSPLGGDSYSIPISITVNGSADAGAASSIAAEVEAAVRRALANIENQKARVSYA